MRVMPATEFNAALLQQSAHQASRDRQARVGMQVSTSYSAGSAESAALWHS